MAVLPLAQDGEWKAGHGHRENCHFLKQKLQQRQQCHTQRHNPVTTAVSVKVRKPDGTVETTRTESDGSQQGLTTRCTRCTRCSTCALCHVCSTIFHVFHLSTANQETGWNMISLQSTSICSVLFRSVHDTTSLLK
jgi:hypothetical protein